MQEEFKSIAIDYLKPNELNPRSIDKESIEKLSRNIQKVGLLQNLVVTPNMERLGFYTIIVGEQRWRAAQRNGEKELPCRVIEDMKEEEQIIMMLSENQMRKDFTAAEIGKLVQRLQGSGWNWPKISEHIGISEETLRDWVKLEKKATPKTKAVLAPADTKRIPRGKIGTEASQIITALPIPDEKKDDLVAEQVKQRLSVKALGQLKKMSQSIPELETEAIFKRATEAEIEERLDAVTEGSIEHRKMIVTAESLLRGNGFATDVALNLLGTKPDVVGVSGKHVVLVEVETVRSIFKKRMTQVSGYSRTNILVLPGKLLSRFQSIWFIDGDVQQVLSQIKGKPK